VLQALAPGHSAVTGFEGYEPFDADIFEKAREMAASFVLQRDPGMFFDPLLDGASQLSGQYVRFRVELVRIFHSSGPAFGRV